LNTKQMRIPFFQKLALLALALGFVILFSDQLMPIANALDQASTDAGLRTPLSLPRGVAQINITPSGFVPTVITVTTGTDVVWRNNTSQIHLLMSGQPFDLLLPLILRNDPSASQTKQQPNHVYLPLVSGNPAGMQATPQPTIRPAVSAPERSGRSPSFGINPRAPLSNGAVFSATLPVGGMFTYTFTTGGDFPYFLATAPQFRGNVIVQTGLPPDPSTVAPPVDPSVPTDIASATSFLYTGNNPIQTGVAANTIDAKRVAVIRGKVLTRDGAPLSGVRITILSHPEFGQTLSREDGMFDLASNGGGLLTFDYQKDGYLPVQRKNNVPWRDFAWLPDVVMIPVDSRTTTMRLPSSGMQVARGSVVSDKSGTRQATLYVPPGTQATLILPGGVTQTMTTFHVRITEFTEGDTGPKAMPGELPPQSGYTYAVDYTMDEAVVAGALNVTFSQPLIHYSENFLGFPVGMNVPTGYYDRVQGQWVASPNGKVIKIVSIINGMANLDTTGSGAIDNGAALGVTDAERQMLASLYASGQILWRVPVSHFSPWDCNWPYGPPDDATAPKQPPPGDPPLPDPCPKDGSIIGCESQTLGETVAIAGTPFRLSYSSQRMPGRKENLSLRIPLSGSTIPASLKRIDLEVYVAGQVYTSTFAAAPNLSTSYTWDGKDAYGRTLQGSQPINVRIGYVYDAVYRTPAELENAFSNFGNAITGVRVRDEVTVWQEWQGTIGGWDSRPVGLGGWEMDVHHAYSPNDGVLYLGDGSQSSAQGISIYSITTVAGNGEYGYNGDGIPATQARLYGPSRVAVGPDGSLYIADGGNHRIRRVGPDGIITTVAGNGEQGYNGDGIPATQARLSHPFGVAVGPDGSLYIADLWNNRIRRVGPDGIITTVAGTGEWGYNGDGIPATQARLSRPFGVAVGPDGSLYIADWNNHRIRRVGPDGIITTVAGNGEWGYNGDGIPATQAQLSYPYSVPVGPDGSLYIADWNNHRIRRVGPDGIITTVAGNGEYGYSGDGIPATQARLSTPADVEVGPDGSLYIADLWDHRIRRVGPDGIIKTVAGNGEQGYNGDGIPATQAKLNTPSGVAVGPDGSLYIADWNNHRIRRLKAELPGFGQNSVLIPSDDGSEVYHFSGNGRHLRTLDALTGAVRYQFTYDSAERLNQVTDGDGNVTTIEHDSNGKPTAIVAPFGQRTTLQVDANGYLSRITNPASEAMQLVSTAHGLLTKMTDPRGNVYQYTYDSLGRLTRDDNPVGGYKTLSRVETSAGYKVTVSTALGRQTTYQIERLAVGGVRRTVTDPSGGITIAVYRNDGTIQTTYPDGTQATLTTGPDPRWGMLAPIETSLVINTPGGIVSTRIMTRTATLANADDPFSLTAMTDTVTFNGATYISQYTAATRTVNNTSPAGRHSSAILDSHGRVTQVASDGEDSTSFTYDSQGRLQKVQRGVRSTTYNYNSAGKIASQTDAEANQTQYSYDAVGRLTQTRLPSNSLYRFGYDADGNLTQVTMPSNSAHNLTYTAVDQRATYTPPGGSAYSWIYDKDKELTRADLPGSVSQTYTLDAGGRSTGTSYPGASTSFAYSDVTNRVTVISHTATLGGTQSINLTYAGENVTAVNWSGVATGQYAYSHGNDLLLKGITLDTNPQIVIARDADGLVTQYGSFAFTRNGPRGAITQISDGKLTATYGYNTLGNFSGRSSSVAGNSLYQEQLTYDNVGRIKQKVETVLGVTRTYNYTFDASGQLLTVRRDGTSVEQYGYDANGNRTSRKFGTNPADTASYDSQDRLVQQGSVTYQFNAAGYLTQRGSDTFQYSVRGELVQATVGGQTVTYSYDGLGRRVGRTDASGTYQYLYGNPDNLLQITATRDPASVRTILYYDEGGRLLAFQRGGTWYYVASDYIGTPRVVSDANGTAVKSLEYDGFGRVLSDSNPTFDLPIGFAGGVVDKVTGLMRFGFRDYDPEAGRWTARDPVLFDGHQGNLYVYASNNPIQLVDPWGLFSFDASGCVGVCFGVKLGITSEGFSWCGELGFGEGASIGVDPLGELDKAGSSFNVEATAKVAFFRGKLKLEKKPDCLRWTSRLGDKIGPEFCAGPFCTGGDNLKVKGKPGNLLKGVGDLFKGFGVGLQFREVYRNCVRW
jgi:RHS repeat-associated protein